MPIARPLHLALPLRTFLLLTLGLLAGCSQKQAAQPASQVVAKVNSYEITASEVSGKLAHLKDIPPDRLASEKRQVIDGLVDQQLAVEQAQVRKLDRTPDVVAAIEQAKREILARAYFEEVASLQVKPTQDEINAYYQAHPELFRERRIYSIKEVTVRDSPEVADYINGFVASGKPIEQLAQWLQAKGIRFNADAASRPAELLPLEFLPAMVKQKDGGLVQFKTEQGLYVAQIMSSRLAPLSQVAAASSIERFLENQRGREAVKAETERMRAGAKIEYLNESAPVQASVAEPPPEVPPAGDSAKSNVQPDADVVRRGIGGLK
ncbi:MAG: EpsD family peptidyl-prolyl cis-trans isomerase [Burkholderiaceae bacterium]|jgi:EpsD family peptidyl-prolyl cis-trans isomerase